MAITKVPNGPLIKKKGPFKGSTLKAGGVIKKAQSGASLEERKEARRVSDSIKKEKLKKVYSKSYEETKKPGQSYDDWYNAYNEQTKINSFKAKEPKGERTFFGGDNGPKSPCKGGKCSGLNSSSRNGSTIKKAKAGTKVKKAFLGSSMFKDNPIYKKTTDLRGKLGSAALGMPGMKPIVKNGSRIKKAQDGEYLTKEGNNYTSTKKVKTKNGPRYYQGSSPSMSFARTIASDKARKINDSIPKARLSPRALEMMNKKNGGMIKRADGSMSKRGLWDNIRANKGSGKKPTKQMLVQEKKIKAKAKK